MKAYWGVEVWFHVFLFPAIDGGEWSASRTDVPDIVRLIIS